MDRINKILNLFDVMNNFVGSPEIESLWKKYLENPVDKIVKEQERSSIRSRIKTIQEKFSPIVIKNVGKRGTSQNLAHQLYWQLASIAFHFCGEEPNCNADERNMVDDLRSKKYCELSSDIRTILYKCFGRIFELLNIYSEKCGNNYVHPPASVRHGYSFGDTRKKILRNQRFCPCVPDYILNKMAEVFAESHLDQMLQLYFGSHFCVSNIRPWKYCAIGAVAGGGETGVHLDLLPPGTIKMMMFDGDITVDHGCFETLDGKMNVTYQAIGHHPGFLADSCNVHHRALSPKPGFERDTIEITMMPFLFPEEKIFVEGGCCSGGPLNPFAHDIWMKRIYEPTELLK